VVARTGRAGKLEQAPRDAIAVVLDDPRAALCAQLIAATRLVDQGPKLARNVRGSLGAAYRRKPREPAVETRCIQVHDNRAAATHRFES